MLTPAFAGTAGIDSHIGVPSGQSANLPVVRPRVYELLTPPAVPAVTELSLVSLLTGESETIRIDASLVVIGRSSQCDLRLMHADVSRRHACLHVLQDRVLCVDLGSRTGILCDGKRHQAGWLDRHHPIQIGPFELRHISPDGAAPEAEVPEAEAFFCRQPPAEPARRGTGLRFLNQKDPATRDVALARPITLIGRGKHCKLRLRDESVSRVHSSVMVTTDGIWLTDLLGRGGVKVNGELVSRARLAPGDELQIGRYRMQFVTDLDAEPLSIDVLPAVAQMPAIVAHAPLHVPGPLPVQGLVSESLLLAMTETFADMQRQMHEQFRLQMDFMAGLVESVRQEANGEIRNELARLATISEEIRDAQRLLSQAALAGSMSPPCAEPSVEAVPKIDASLTSSQSLATPDETVASSPNVVQKKSAPSPRAADRAHSRDAVTEHALLTRRLRDLERERNSRWTNLVGLLTRNG